MDKLFGCNLDFVRDDDFVEYFIFPQLNNLVESDYEQMRLHLAAALKQCEEIVQGLIRERNYIWHKDEFQLQIRTGDARERLLREELSTKEGSETVLLPPHLHGVTHFGDNIADEWFVVFLLGELTRQLSGYVARVVDSDGEFLLIEAADVLPKWANPNTCEQRVYIVDGGVQLVEDSPSNTDAAVTVTTAVNKIRQNPTQYRVSKEIQQCITDRLKEFLQQPNAALHQQIVRLPLGVATLLKQRPALISSAVRAFCERDPIDTKVCRSMRYFPPEQRVRASVCFTRCLYAMLTHSRYVPDRKIGWNLTGAANSEQYKEDLLGVKIACGFEILASQAKEVGSIENEPAWHVYFRSLSSKGYFRGNLEGSEEYERLLADAKAYFEHTNEHFRTAPQVGKEILELLRCTEINAEQLRSEENNLKPSDPDDWLNISAEQLDAMLQERYGPKKLYNVNGDINAEEFTKNLADFLEKESTFDGVDCDPDDTKKTTATTTTRVSNMQHDPKVKVRKNQSMRKACKQYPINMRGGEGQGHSQIDADEECNASTHVRNFLDFVIPEDNWDSNSEMSDYEDDDDLERNIEAMTMTNTAANIDEDIKAYMAQMDRELAKTTIGQTFQRTSGNEGGAGAEKPTTKATAADDDFDDIETFEPININVNTLKNMMDSYKSQIGGSGPVSNLLNAMGMGMSTDAEIHDQVKDITESTV